MCGLNVIVAGGTQAGKTTLLGCLLACVPPGERVDLVRGGLRAPASSSPDWVALQTRQPSLEGTGEIRLRRLVKEALRMRPSRIVVGEVRQEECLDLLIALNSGLPGMCTVHANSAREAVTKLCTLPLLAGENVGHAFVVPTVAAAVDLVVHVATEPRRRAAGARDRRAARSGRERRRRGRRPLRHARRRLVRADGYPPHPERFAERGFDLAALLAPEAGVNGAVRRAGARRRLLLVLAGRDLADRPARRGSCAGTASRPARPSAGLAGVGPGGFVAGVAGACGLRRRSSWSLGDLRLGRCIAVAFGAGAVRRPVRAGPAARRAAPAPTCARCGRTSSTTSPRRSGPGSVAARGARAARRRADPVGRAGVRAVRRRLPRDRPVRRLRSTG